ncbi:Uncharacterised protein [Salmonella enterica subsp. enterica serovar Typhi]|nr:Uncharacterised protein [Salmonella enterica subsp. enterica serovar Typhi]
MAAQGVQRTRKPPRKIRADFVTGHACHRAKLTQGGHKFVGASGRLVSIEADSFRHCAVLPGEATHTPAHRHKGIFVNAQHLRILVSPVIRHAAEFLSNARKNSGHVTHVTAGITGLYAQAIQKAFCTGIVTNKPGEAFQRRSRSVHAAANLRNRIANRLNSLDCRAGAL